MSTADERDALVTKVTALVAAVACSRPVVAGEFVSVLVAAADMLEADGKRLSQGVVHSVIMPEDSYARMASATLTIQQEKVAAEKRLAVAEGLLGEFVSPDDDCWFDHHGGCQAHGFLDLKAGEKCPHARVKAILTQQVDAAKEALSAPKRNNREPMLGGLPEPDHDDMACYKGPCICGKVPLS